MTHGYINCIPFIIGFPSVLLLLSSGYCFEDAIQEDFFAENSVLKNNDSVWANEDPVRGLSSRIWNSIADRHRSHRGMSYIMTCHPLMPIICNALQMCVMNLNFIQIFTDNFKTEQYNRHSRQNIRTKQQHVTHKINLDWSKYHRLNYIYEYMHQLQKIHSNIFKVSSTGI